MSRQISEQGGDAALKKRIRQAVYDIRYKARKDELDLRHAYSQYIGKSGLDQTGKEAVQNKLFGKRQQAESNVLESAGSNKYKVRFSDPETEKTTIKYAKRDKINKLRTKGSVEMTGHGSPKGAKNAPSIKKKDSKRKLKAAGPAPKKVALSKKKPGAIALPKKPKKAKPVQVQVVDPKKMENNKTDVVGSAVQSLRKIVRKEAFIADSAAVAPPVNKKITGEKVDNSKLIKVFPQDGSDPQIGSIKSSYKPVGEVVAEIVNPQQVDEVVGQVVGGLLGATKGAGLAKAGLTKVAGALTKAGAPAAVGKALTSKAAPKIAGAALGSAAGEVLDPFKKNKDKNPVAAAAGGAAGGAVHGAIKSSYKPVGEVVAEILANEDMQKGYEVTNADKKANTPAWQGYVAGKKKKDGTPLYRKAAHMEEVGVSTSAKMDKAKKEAELQKKEQGAVKKVTRWQDNNNNGKWYEKGVDVKKEEFADPFYKQVEYDDDDPRSMKTKWNLVKNRLRSLGLKCSNELEGDKIEEGKVGSAVGSLAGTVGGALVGGAAGGKLGAAVGGTVGSAAGAALGAKKGRKGSAAVGGAVAGPVGAAIGASHELEGDTLAEDEAIREARRADKMGIPRKKVTYDKGEETRNPNPDRGAAPSFKPEGGSLAGSKAASRARSLGDARRKANRKGANLAYGKREGRLATFAANKRDSDSDLGSQKAATDTGAHKDKQGFRQVHKYGERGDKRRPQQNPKHTANEEVVLEADSLSATVDRWEAARQKRMKQRQSYERPHWIPRDQDHEDNWGSSKGEKKKPQNEHHQVDAKGKVIEHGDGTPSSVEESKGYVCESTLVRNILTKKNYTPVEELGNINEAPGVGAAIKYGGKWAVRQGIKVGGKKGGYAVKKAGSAAVGAGKEVAAETGRGVARGLAARKDELVRKAGEAGENFATNVGRPVAVDTARRTLKDDEKTKRIKQANESVAAPAKPAKKPVGKGEKIGKVVGGIAGSIGGGAAGGLAGGGVASLATGVAGSLAGGEVGDRVGGAIGKKFDKKPTVKKENFSNWRNDLTVDEAKVDAGLSPEEKEKVRNKRKFGVTHNVVGHAKLRRSLAKMNRGDKKIPGDKSAWTEMESVQLGEEGYDKIKDQRLMDYGIGHDGSDRLGSKSRSTMRPTGQKLRGKTVLQRETEKKYGKGVSAVDVVKQKIEDKYGKGAIAK